MNKGSILEMPEDLLDEDQSKQRSKSQATQSIHAMSKRNQPTSESTLDELMTKVANALGAQLKSLPIGLKKL
jgi:hypothetical protein